MSKPRLKQGRGTPDQLRECGFAPIEQAVADFRHMAEEMEANVKKRAGEKGVWLKWHVQLYYGYELDKPVPPTGEMIHTKI